MNAHRAVEQLHRLADMLDRARAEAQTEVADLEALLTEAARSLHDLAPAIATADAESRVALTIATRRAHASQVALEHTLRQELGRVERQLDHMSSTAVASGRYATAAVPAHRLDRLG